MFEALEYEQLLEAYEASLITVLRGFTAGIPFLHTWVPDEDHGFSILGVFEAAAEAGMPQLELRLSEARLAEVGEARLSELLANLGTVIFQGTLLRVVFEAREAGLARVARAAVTVAPATARSEQMTPVLEPLRAGWDLPERYHEALARLAEPITHRVEQCDPSGLCSRRLGACLQVQLGAEHRLIERAVFCGDAQGTTALLLEYCCRSIEGRPLYEAADHGVITMEASLRGKGPRPAQGIVLAERSVPAFALLNEMLRELNQQAGEAQANFFEAPVGTKWRKSSDEGKIQWLEEVLEMHPLSEKAAVVRVEGQRRVVVAFRDDSLSNSERQQALLELERVFKQGVEPGLHLYLEPKPDKNKLRQQKGIRL